MVEEKKRSLSVDIGGSITEFQAVMKEFLLRNKLYKILIRGKGLEFESFRNYAPDDDATAIDWKASKRANTLLVKQYREERNLKIVFIVDMSENMVFGSTQKLKCEYAAEVVASFAHLIITSGDKAGLIVFSDYVRDYLKPGGGLKHFHRLVSLLTNPFNYGKYSNLHKAFDFAINYLHKDIISVVIVSDFINFNEALVKPLSLIANKFETVALMIRDPLDVTLPQVSGEVVVEDSRTGQQLLINPKIAKEAYEQIARQRERIIREECLKHNVDLLEMMTDHKFVPTLSAFLKGRVKKVVYKK
ncbi:DUF58 domain-containing protein [Candidatus Pacearchaeota archaeon]|nr:DUF58 domain-containing protein [Candidatus Pacearchaeota archaeon]